MEIFIIFYLAIFGLVFGSFFNVVGLRVPMKQSIVKPRSACPICHHQLTAKELIPVFSYLIQGGKCRSCKAPISVVYPLMESVTAILFAVAPLIIGWSNELLLIYPLISMLVIITVSDLAYMLIPDKVLLFFAALFLLYAFIPGGITILDALLGAAAGFGVLLIIALVSKGGMGGGDIKLFAVLGLALGIKMIILTLFFSALYGAIIGSVLMATRIVKRKQPIPFGPFIAVGALTACFFGERLVNWYFGVIV